MSALYLVHVAKFSPTTDVCVSEVCWVKGQVGVRCLMVQIKVQGVGETMLCES